MSQLLAGSSEPASLLAGQRQLHDNVDAACVISRIEGLVTRFITTLGTERRVMGLQLMPMHMLPPNNNGSARQQQLQPPAASNAGPVVPRAGSNSCNAGIAELMEIRGPQVRYGNSLIWQSCFNVQATFYLDLCIPGNAGTTHILPCE